MNIPTRLRDSIYGIIVPENSRDHWMLERYEDSHIGFYVDGKTFGDEGFSWSESIEIPFGSWQIICLSGEATEYQAGEVIGLVEREIVVGYIIASLHSLLRSKNLPVNNTLILQKLK